MFIKIVLLTVDLKESSPTFNFVQLLKTSYNYQFLTVCQKKLSEPVKKLSLLDLVLIIIGINRNFVSFGAIRFTLC